MRKTRASQWKVEAFAAGRLLGVYTHRIFSMRFSWDPLKSDINLERRGFDFAFASRIFERATVQRPDGRREYGEQRIVATGAVDGLLVTLVYTDRMENGETVRRIISARGASRNERKAYAQAIEETGWG